MRPSLESATLMSVPGKTASNLTISARLQDEATCRADQLSFVWDVLMSAPGMARSSLKMAAFP